MMIRWFVLPCFVLALPAVIIPRPHRLIGQEIDFDSLIEVANKYQLPMPSADAKLVLATKGWSTTGGTIYHPAFSSREKAKVQDNDPLVLFGWTWTKAESRDGSERATRRFTLNESQAHENAYVIRVNNLGTFVTAVQLAARGEIDLAKELWGKFKACEHIDADNARDFVKSLVATPNILLARCIYQHYFEMCREENADLQLAHRMLVELQIEFPSLFSEGEQCSFRKARTQFVHDLGLTVTANETLPRSVEGLLLQWGNMPGKFRHLGYFDSNNVESDHPAREIFNNGLDAIPELALLRKDRRVTRHINPAFNNRQESQVRLGQLAGQLLEDIVGSVGVDQAIDMVSNGQVNEKAFFEQAAIEIQDGEVKELFEVPMRILVEKYPESMGKLCGHIQAGVSPKTQLHGLAQAVIATSLPQEQQSAALTNIFASLSSLGQKRSVLQYLVNIDEDACVELLLPILDALPKDVGEPYWESESANFVHVIVQCKDAQVWEKYLVAVKRASVGLRMEMMNSMNYTYMGEMNIDQRIVFMAAFLEDSEVRLIANDENGKYEGPCAAFTFPKIEVRNFVAMQIASLLPEEMKRPDKNWTEMRWALFRVQVKQAIAAKGLELPNANADKK